MEIEDDYQFKLDTLYDQLIDLLFKNEKKYNESIQK
jgi:hypothetical protein